MTAAGAMHESAHAARVREAIRARIAAAGGWLPFDEYMQMALYEPGLGYYSAGARKLGTGGDFTTAPEMSVLFGRCLARHCAAILAACGGGDVLEAGAGSGRLAFDVLSALHDLGTLPGRYLILEVSADLRERQRKLLATLPGRLAARVEWLDEPPATAWRGALVANEVLDALPVQCFAWRDGQVFERGVGIGGGPRFVWQEREASRPLREEVLRLRTDAGAQWPQGFQSELCVRVGPWIQAVTQAMEHGVALFIDYGLPRRDFYDARRHTGTLRCHHRQLAHEDPFANPGMEDITAWVDFTRVAEAGDTAALEVLGFATQAGLLLGLGIEGDVAAAADDATRIRLAGEARRLLMPEEMGENFKAIALGRGFDAPLAGFAHQDLRRYL
jgi:SAM-dependent MidA family methyltransferase